MSSSLPSPALTTRQTPVYATGGMVATAHPLATAAGLQMLAVGGNAVDAALAAAAVTWVTLPMMCGPGGDGFLIIHAARTGRLTAIGGSGVVGARATPDTLAAAGYTQTMPLTGLLSAAVPGCIGAFEAAQTRFGTRPWPELLAAAIRYCAGHPISHDTAAWIALSRDKLTADPAAARIFLPGGRAPVAGELLVQADLGRTLARLARYGTDDFYRGEIAAAIAGATAVGGLFGTDELAAHTTDIYTPLAVEYRGHRIHQTAPPSQGIIHLEAMKIVEGFDLPALGPGAAAQHLMVEATKLAVSDRLRYLGDPRQVPDATARLLSPAHIAERRRGIDPNRATPAPGGYVDGDTTYLCVVDGDGNAVSLIHSLSHAFGSGVVVPDTGVLLNNRAGRGFELDPAHPNVIAPGKRTIHTLNCYLVTRDGRPVLVGGTPGGDGQFQWNLQVLANILDWGMDVQAAVTAPRWTVRPATDPSTRRAAEALILDDHFAPDVVAGLRQRGHPVRLAPAIQPGAITGAQVIAIDAGHGVLAGGSDPRAGGYALGL